MGAPAKKSRVAFGSLIIKEKLRITDREEVEQIKENPYLQYFLGYECYYDKKPGKKKIRKAIGIQLKYLSRNLKDIKELSKKSYLKLLSKKEYKDLLVIHKLYRQQKHMYDNKTHNIEGRIVSISQPHVRPIVRGKTSAKVEFGAKISGIGLNYIYSASPI